MGTEYGAFLSNGHVVLRPESGKQIITEGNPFEQIAYKLPAATYASNINTVLRSLTTTDATVTPIISITLAPAQCGMLFARVYGAQNDNTDTVAATAIGAAANQAGTTALEGTPLYQIVEGDANTNITITADDTTDTLRLNITGVAAQTWKWIAIIEYVILTPAS